MGCENCELAMAATWLLSYGLPHHTMHNISVGMHATEAV